MDGGHPTLFELEEVGAGTVLRDDPRDVAAAVSASVMRKLDRIRDRQIGTCLTEIRDALEIDLSAALKAVKRYKDPANV